MRAKDIICHKISLSSRGEHAENASVASHSDDLPGVCAEAHIIEVIERMVESGAERLSVTDSEGHCVGFISRQSLLEAVARLCNAPHRGTVIEVEMLPEDYTATELARLVEDNRCKIINLFAFPHAETGLLGVQMRINCEEPAAVLQSLERYGYRITAIYRSEGRIDERAEQRLRELLYYLEM